MRAFKLTWKRATLEALAITVAVGGSLYLVSLIYPSTIQPSRIFFSPLFVGVAVLNCLLAGVIATTRLVLKLKRPWEERKLGRTIVWTAAGVLGLPLLVLMGTVWLEDAPLTLENWMWNIAVAGIIGGQIGYQLLGYRDPFPGRDSQPLKA